MYGYFRRGCNRTRCSAPKPSRRAADDSMHVKPGEGNFQSSAIARIHERRARKQVLVQELEARTKQRRCCQVCFQKVDLPQAASLQECSRWLGSAIRVGQRRRPNDLRAAKRNVRQIERFGADGAKSSGHCKGGEGVVFRRTEAVSKQVHIEEPQ